MCIRDSIITNEYLNTPNENSNVIVYLGDGDEGFTKEIVYTGKAPRDVSVGDWDNDGDIDILASLYEHISPNDVDDMDIAILSNDGNATFSASEFGSTERVNAILLNDIDNDGDLDLIMAKNNTERIEIGINEAGQINDTYEVSDQTGGLIVGMDAGVINGKKQIVYADNLEHQLVLINTGIDSLVGIQEVINQLASNITVYPNPSSDIISVTSESQEIQLKEVTLFNSMGQQIFTQNIIYSIHQVDIEAITPGIYHLSVTTNLGKMTKKIVKQ